MARGTGVGTLLLLVVACSQGEPWAGAPGVAETRAEFEGICRDFKAGSNQFYGERIVGELGRDMEGQPGLRYKLGMELLRLGRIDEAIGNLEQVRTITGLPPQARRQVDLGLALAHLREAATVNCVGERQQDACTFPLSAEAAHRSPDHARAAGGLLLSLLRSDPSDLRSRWLLNVARMYSGDYPAGVPVAARLPGAELTGATFPRWRDVAPRLGVDVVDLAGGAAMDDFDGDGWLDLVTSNNDPCGPAQAFRGDGKGGFEEVSAAWGLDGQLGGLNLIHGDFDNDGRPDLLILRGGWWQEDGHIRNSLLRNELGETRDRFVDVTAEAGLASPAYPTQTAAFADYDGDGDLDLYVGNESYAEDCCPSQLLRNDGSGHFEEVTAAAGVANLRYSKAVAWGDFDNDGDPDLYVSNLGPNRLYRNNGDGTFSDVATLMGVSAPTGRSFGSWFFDYDNDRDLDLFVNDYGSSVRDIFASYLGFAVAGGHPLVYRNDGAVFTEVSQHLGLRRPALPMGANYGDLDNDGFLDIYLGTGIPAYEALMPNLMLRNVGGSAFEDVTFAGGFGHLQKGHGVAFGDMDNDGDQDLLHQLGGQLPGDFQGNALFKNPGNENRWITLRLEGKWANRFGVGARIAVAVRTDDEARVIHVLAGTGGSFGSSSLQQEIGLGDAQAIDSITVRWPGSGTIQTFHEASLDGVYRVLEDRPELLEVAE